MNTLLLYSFSFILFSCFLYGKNEDTTKTYNLNDVVITGTRNSSIAEKLSSSVSVITASEIESSVGNSVATAINGITGLFLKSYGGTGGLTTISLRGMSAEHTVILVDGIRFSSVQNGLSDVAIIPTSNVERIELLKGGSSSMYGSDAIAGVMNIITKEPTERLEGVFSSSIGSYGYNAFEGAIGAKVGSKVGVQGNFRRERGDGNYKFNFSDGMNETLLQRNGADFSLFSAGGKIDWHVTDDITSFITLSLRDAKRGDPNPVTNAFDLSKTRLNDYNTDIHLGLNWKQSEKISTRLGSSFQYGEETYDNPLLVFNGNAIHDVYFNRSVILEPVVNVHLSEVLSGAAGSELSRSWITSNEVKSVVRYQQSIFLSMQHTPFTFNNAPIEFTLFPSIRYDNFSDVGGTTSAKIGANIGIVEVPSVHLRSSYGSSFHAPTFNELYWLNGGNPKVKPERSTSFDCGGVMKVNILGSLFLEANYFSIHTKERILWKPNGNGIWSPKNIGSVQSEGIELQGTWKTLAEKMSLSVNATLGTVKKTNRENSTDQTYGKQLVYLPQQVTNFAGMYTVNNAIVTLQHSWVSFRYITEMNDRILPQYGITSASIIYNIPVETYHPFIKIEATNLFNKPYQIMPSYPMPLREFHLTIGVKNYEFN